MTDDLRPAATGRLKLSTILTFSLATIPTSALGIALGIYLPRYFAGHLGVGLGVVGAAFFAVRMIDIPVDPVLGVLMDRTRTRIGRYRVWFLTGAPILMLAVYQLFMAKPGIGEVYIVGWLLVLYLGTSILGLSQGAWSATLAPEYNERTRLFGITSMVSIVATVAVLAIPIIPTHLSEAADVQAMGWVAILLAPLCVGIVAWRVPEKVSADVETHRFPLSDYLAIARKPEILRLFFAQACLTLGPGWMSALYLFFFGDVLHFSFAQSSGLLILYILAGVAGAPATAWVSSRLNKHRTLIAATTAYSIGLCTIFVLPRGQFFVTAPVMLWCGFMASGFGLLTSSMTADVGDEVRLEQGRQRMSLIYSVTGLAAKIAGAFAFAFSFGLLAAVGYQAKEGAHNTQAAIQWLEYIYILGPIFFVMVGGACFVGWKLDATRHGEIRAALDARDAALGEAALLEGLTGQAVAAPAPGE
ncbi:MAG TPA: MFS transporter [Caulobacteraceae bacterium]|nr:MFS transporter [Caulobacteraceae bacterium]